MRNTRADVVRAALRVLGEEGLEGCSMRRIAGQLGVQPSALYHHVPNKQTLLALMADEIVRGVASARGEGAVDPRALCIRLRTAMLDVRDGADVVATATAFRIGTSALESALAGAVGADGARTLLLYTFGHAQSTQTHRQAEAFGALLDAPAAASGAEETGSDLDASFERGLDIILKGLSA